MNTTTYPRITNQPPAGAPYAKEQLLRQELARTHEGGKVTCYRLVFISEGYACAGSMMRWDNACYAVLFEMDHATHGRRFKTLAEAQEMFDRCTAIPA